MNIALIKELYSDFEISYVGESSSVEEKLVQVFQFHFFHKSGKLGRYFSLKNILDPLK